MALLVADVVKGDKVTLIPRLRRFGKTLNITMQQVKEKKYVNKLQEAGVSQIYLKRTVLSY